MVGHQIFKKIMLKLKWLVTEGCQGHVTEGWSLILGLKEGSVQLIHQIINDTVYTKTKQNGVHDTAVWDFF